VLAVQISRHDGPEELVLTEVPDPEAAAGQVVVRNSWIGVNYVDLQHREGRPYPVQLPLIPGTEAAGTVVAVGAGADPGLLGAPVVHFGHLCGVYGVLVTVLSPAPIEGVGSGLRPCGNDCVAWSRPG
jgi:NADPH:quinone reductase